MKIKILLADDHAILRQGLRSLLEEQGDIEVVEKSAADGRKAVELAGKFKPDIVIMDVTMPNLNGVDATRKIVSQYTSIKVIALSIHSNRHFVADMLRAGASGYILKESVFDELVKAIRIVAAGGNYLSPRITDVVVGDYVEFLSGQFGSKQEILTEREHEVLQLIAEGKDTKKIAKDLYVSVKTIEANRRRLMDKLEIYSVAELTKYAIREGLTSVDK